MLRLLLILILLFYVLYKLGLFRVVVHQVKEGYTQTRKNQAGGVHIKQPPAKNKRKPGFNGGEYIDYEEVK